METLLITSIFLIGIGYLLKQISKYKDFGIGLNVKNAFIFLLGWVILGFLEGLDYSDAYGCIVGFEPNSDSKNIIFSTISFVLILWAFKTENLRIKKILFITELVYWIAKLMVFKGGYAVGYAGTPGTSIVFYDLVAIISRLFILSQLLKVVKHKFVKIGIVALVVLSVKITMFATPLSMIYRGLDVFEASKEISITSYGKGELVAELDEKIWDIYQDSKGNYWFGSNGEGIYFYDGVSLRKYTIQDGLINNTIRGIQGDHLGNVFIETPEGISKYDGKTFTNLKPIIAPFNEWKLEPHDLWFNCNGNPNDVYRYDGELLYELKLPRKNLYKAFGKVVLGLGFEGMNSSPYSVFGLDRDKAGNLWIGTIVAGAYRYDGESFLWIAEKELTTLPDGRVPGVRSMIEDRDGNIWLSNFISKYKISEKNGMLQYEKLAGVDMSKGHFQNRIPYFNSGLADNKGDLWMTTYTGGVWKYDGNELHNFPVKDGEKEVLLISIYEDSDGVLWLGTDNAGVYKFNGKTFDKFEPMKK